MTWQLLCGDVRQKLTELEPESVHMAVTSPPFWGLRKYSGEQDLVWGGDENCQHEWNIQKISLLHENRNFQTGTQEEVLATGHELRHTHKTSTLKAGFCSLCGAWRGAYGLEPTPELYIRHTVEILQGIRRVLRSDGVVFWNIGDSYWGGKAHKSGETNPGKEYYTKDTDNFGSVDKTRHDILKPLDLCLIPERLAIALQEDGWWCRSIIIWHKSNPMPESVNGWRWERHKIPQCPQCGSFSSIKKRVCTICGWKKPANRGEEEAWRAETGQQEHDGSGFRSGSFMVDCPDCPKCSPNDGLVLRKGSWRPTDAYEQILMLTKTANYYCDAEAVREPYSETVRWGGDKYKGAVKKGEHGEDAGLDRERGCFPNVGRNLRNVWSFPTKPYPEAHFAVFPEKLPELCIKATTPEVGVCAKCGAPWARVIERVPNPSKQCADGDIRGWSNTHQKTSNPQSSRSLHRNLGGVYHQGEAVGWRPTCSCNCPDIVPATVLDPFAGAGTTLLVAERLGRDSIGIDISAEYCALAVKRIIGVK